MSYISERIKNECAASPEFAAEYNQENERLEIAIALMELREREGLTQKQLAELAHKPQSTIARIENGSLNPSYKVLSEIAQSVGKRLAVQFL